MRKFILLAIVVLLATSVHSADSLYIYERGVRKYAPVDTIQILVKWESFLGQLGQTGWLSAYPNINGNQFEPFKADNFFLHFLTGTYNYNAIVAQLEADPHVLAVNKVLDVGEGLSIYFGDRIICRFAPGTSRPSIDSLLLANQLTVTEEWSDAPNQFTVRTGTNSPLGTLDLANYLEELPAVEWAHPNWKGNCTLHGYFVRDSLFHYRQWNVKKSVGYKSTSNYGAWEITSGSPSINVAVLDGGMEPHEDFSTGLWLPGRDFVDHDTIPEPIYPEPDSITEAHGMAVLGLIAAAHNNPVNIGIGLELAWQSTAGVSPGVSIIRVRIFDQWGFGVAADSVAHALYFAMNSGADVINCSWGYYGRGPNAVIKAVDSAIYYGRNGKGCILVASAGNDGTISPYWEQYPAASDSVISVGAIGADDRWLYYSSAKAHVDVVAGSASGSCSLSKNNSADTCTDTLSTYYTVDRMNEYGYNPKKGAVCSPKQDVDYICDLGGTSFSAPQVTGIVALLLSIEPNLTRNQVLDIIRKSANKVLAWGTVQPSQYHYYGHGRANAVRALSTVRRGDSDASGAINVSDINYLVAYLYQSGPAPFPDKYFGDANCTGGLNTSDITYLIKHLFQGGPPPAMPCTAFLLD